MESLKICESPTNFVNLSNQRIVGAPGRWWQALSFCYAVPAPEESFLYVSEGKDPLCQAPVGASFTLSVNPQTTPKLAQLPGQGVAELDLNPGLAAPHFCLVAPHSWLHLAREIVSQALCVRGRRMSQPAWLGSANWFLL